jgi:hypothetical protein
MAIFTACKIPKVPGDERVSAPEKTALKGFDSLPRIFFKEASRIFQYTYSC